MMSFTVYHVLCLCYGVDINAPVLQLHVSVLPVWMSYR